MRECKSKIDTQLPVLIEGSETSLFCTRTRLFRVEVGQYYKVRNLATRNLIDSSAFADGPQNDTHTRWVSICQACDGGTDERGVFNVHDFAVYALFVLEIFLKAALNSLL